MRKNRDPRLWLAVLACLAILAVLYGSSLVASATTRQRALEPKKEEHNEINCGEYEMERQYDSSLERPAGYPVL
jgi:hypothetical protein